MMLALIKWRAKSYFLIVLQKVRTAAGNFVRITNAEQPTRIAEVEKLSAANKVQIDSFAAFVQAIETRRAWFIENGAIATDLSVVEATTADVPAAVINQSDCKRPNPTYLAQREPQSQGPFRK